MVLATLVNRWDVFRYHCQLIKAWLCAVICILLRVCVLLQTISLVCLPLVVRDLSLVSRSNISIGDTNLFWCILLSRWLVWQEISVLSGPLSYWNGTFSSRHISICLSTDWSLWLHSLVSFSETHILIISRTYWCSFRMNFGWLESFLLLILNPSKRIFSTGIFCSLQCSPV